MTEYTVDEFFISEEMIEDQESYEALAVINDACASFMNGNDIKITFPTEETYHEFLIDWPFMQEPSVEVSWFEDYE